MPGILHASGLLATGALSGVIGALLGLGGGIFLIPALVLVFAVPMHSAVAAGLVAVIATSSAAGSRNAGKGLANVRLGMTLETATVAGALAGSLLAPLLPARMLCGLFALLLVAVSVTLWRRRGASVLQEALTSAAPSGAGLLDGEYQDLLTSRTVRYPVRRLPLAMAASLGAGVMSALLGVGGGIIKVPALNIFCGVPMKAAAATSNLMIGVTAAASATLYLSRGYVPVQAAATVALGVLAGSHLGLWLSHRLSDRVVTRIFAVVTAVIAGLMARRFLVG